MQLLKNFTLLSLLAVAAFSQADVQVRVIAMSKTPQKVTNDIADRYHDQLPDSRVTLTSQGKRFQPLLPSGQSAVSEEPKLYRGQTVKQENAAVYGSVSGSILVELQAGETSIQLTGAETTAIGNGFVLLTFEEDAELLSVLKTLQSDERVKQAELEINTRRYKAH
ncbi:hypothetical protein [Thalassolituus marinus]|uniref:ASP external chaperone domain-containing protein n=1 Tax=Thalassolituus marinus TaxID=671053 RepID=A0ABS7ZNX0_9GAMM|nr:hypothetical protein [Thalassolituus marinus]MCA6063404.1 hypothetical protein [Thalassolituus marinus]